MTYSSAVGLDGPASAMLSVLVVPPGTAFSLLQPTTLICARQSQSTTYNTMCYPTNTAMCGLTTANLNAPAQRVMKLHVMLT